MRVNVYIDSGKILYKENIDLMNFIASTYDENEDIMDINNYIDFWYDYICRFIRKDNKVNFYYYIIEQV